MKTEIYERLKNLHDKYGPQEFGKLCQKLLAIGFRMAGYSHIVERGVQGVDVDAAGENGEKYSIEVKTTVGQSLNFEQKDVDGLQKRKEDGYETVLAVLRLDRFSNWIFAKADTIKSRRLLIDSLRPHRLGDLEERICPCIDEAINEHFDETMLGGQKYLDHVLKQKGITVRES
jgi:Holliday junction resolvase